MLPVGEASAVMDHPVRFSWRQGKISKFGRYGLKPSGLIGAVSSGPRLRHRLIYSIQCQKYNYPKNSLYNSSLFSPFTII